MKKLIVPGLVVLASIFGAVTLMATAPKLKPSSIEPLATTVRVVEANPQPIRLTVHSQGTVVPNTESELIPEVSGRVLWVSPSLVNGGYFEQGEVLLRLEATDYRSALARAEAHRDRAEAEFEHARYEYQRLESLEARQLASKSQMENSLRAFRVAEASLQEARAALEQANRDLERTALTAPFDGLVRREAVDVDALLDLLSDLRSLLVRQFRRDRLTCQSEHGKCCDHDQRQ